MKEQIDKLRKAFKGIRDVEFRLGKDQKELGDILFEAEKNILSVTGDLQRTPVKQGVKDEPTL